jgi:hypothetical protein
MTSEEAVVAHAIQVRDQVLGQWNKADQVMCHE